MKAEVVHVSKWTCHAPPKTELYWVEVLTENNKLIQFMRGATNSPPDNLWEGDEVEIVYRKHKEGDLILPFIVT